MPKQYEALKRKYGKTRAAKIYIAAGKTKAGKSRRAKALRHKK